MLPVRQIDHTRFGDVDPKEREAATLPQRLRNPESNRFPRTAGETFALEVFKEEEEG